MFTRRDFVKLLAALPFTTKDKILEDGFVSRVSFNGAFIVADDPGCTATPEETLQYVKSVPRIGEHWPYNLNLCNCPCRTNPFRIVGVSKNCPTHSIKG